MSNFRIHGGSRPGWTRPGRGIGRSRAWLLRSFKVEIGIRNGSKLLSRIRNWIWVWNCYLEIGIGFLKIWKQNGNSEPNQLRRIDCGMEFIFGIELFVAVWRFSDNVTVWIGEIFSNCKLKTEWFLLSFDWNVFKIWTNC